MRNFFSTNLLVFSIAIQTLAQSPSDPITFAGGFIKTYNGISFSPDGRTLYTSYQILEKNAKGNFQARLFESHLVQGKWTRPVALPIDMELFFNGIVTTPMDTIPGVNWNIWYCLYDREWSTPKLLEGINTAYKESYPSITRSGNLYFTSDRPGGAGGRDFYVATMTDGRYSTPTNIAELNTTDDENDLVVSPDESFMIFNRFIASSRSVDMYISWKRGTAWSDPVALKINAPGLSWELTPALSADGKYFLFELGNIIWQVELSEIIEG